MITRQSLNGLSQSVFLYTPNGERYYSYSDDRQPGLARTHAIFELMGLDESGSNAQGAGSNEQTEHRFFIAPGVIYTRFGAAVSGGEITNIAKEQYTYSFKDRLGSPVVQMITKTGEAPRIERRGFDPFGKPRDGNLLDSNQGRLGPIVPAAGLDPTKLPTSMRGFTDHQHLDGLQLIHMRGRIYDYNLGRFWSVDPIIQFPANSQSLNAYSYIMNNPMSGKDPTGYVIVLIPVAVKAVGYGLTLWGAAEAGYTIGTAANDLATGEKSAGDVAIGAGKDLAVNAAITVTGTRIIKIVDRLTPESVKRTIVEKGGDMVGKNGAQDGQRVSNRGSTQASEIGAQAEVGKAAVGDPIGKTHVTYTKENKETGVIYSGKSSGPTDRDPRRIVADRDRAHHMSKKGFGPAKIDKASSNADAITGREQQLIDKNGGAQSTGGTSGNKNNAIDAKKVEKMDRCIAAATEEFGGC